MVEIQGLQGSSPADDRHKGFLEALAEHPGIQVLAAPYGNWLEESGYEAMKELVEDGVHPDAVFGYGTSFGGFLFLKYLAEHGNPFRRLALRCPAVDIYESLTTKILTPKDAEALRKGRDAELGFDRKVRVNQAFFDELRTVDLFAHDYLDYADDLLILQGTADEIVSYDAVSRFADQNCIELIPFDRADHRFHDPAKMGAAIAEIMKFFAPAFQ